MEKGCPRISLPVRVDRFREGVSEKPEAQKYDCSGTWGRVKRTEPDSMCEARVDTMLEWNLACASIE
jgi:hypothetical protein